MLRSVAQSWWTYMYCHGLCRRKGFSFDHAVSDNIYRGGSRGRVQGVRTPTWDDLGFSNTTGILPKKKKKKNFVVYWRWSRARDECTPSWKTSWIRPWYTQIFCHMWKLRVTDLWCGGFWQVKHWENNCFKLVFLHEYASVMNHCICLSFHMLSLKVFENYFPFNRVLSFLVSENLTSCRLNKYFSTACKESSVQ